MTKVVHVTFHYVLNGSIHTLKFARDSQVQDVRKRWSEHARLEEKDHLFYFVKGGMLPAEGRICDFLSEEEFSIALTVELFDEMDVPSLTDNIADFEECGDESCEVCDVKKTSLKNAACQTDSYPPPAANFYVQLSLDGKHDFTVSVRRHGALVPFQHLRGEIVAYLNKHSLPLGKVLDVTQWRALSPGGKTAVRLYSVDGSTLYRHLQHGMVDKPLFSFPVTAAKSSATMPAMKPTLNPTRNKMLTSLDFRCFVDQDGNLYHDHETTFRHCKTLVDDDLLFVLDNHTLMLEVHLL